MVTEIPENIITGCENAAKAHLNLQSGNVDVDCVSIVDGQIKRETKQSSLIHIRVDQLSAYISLFQQTYNMIAGNAAIVVPIRNAYIFGTNADDYLPNLPNEVILLDCKIKVDANRDGPTFRTNGFFRCDIAGSLRRIYAPKFDQCVFRSACWSDNEMHIANCFFDDRIIINHTSFSVKNSDVKSLDASDVQSVLVEKSNFSNFTVHNSGHCSFRSDGCKFGSTNFTSTLFRGSALFYDIIFEKPPNFNEAEFTSKNVDFGRVQFNDTKSDLALGRFRQLKKMCEDAGYGHGVILFHGLELETHFNLYLRNNCPSYLWPEKAASFFHGLVTDYGRNITRPFIWIGILFLVGFTINRYALSRIDAALYSLQHSVGPMIIAWPKEVRVDVVDAPALYAVSFLQIVITSIIWFVIVLMLRSRFKL